MLRPTLMLAIIAAVGAAQSCATSQTRSADARGSQNTAAAQATDSPTYEPETLTIGNRAPQLNIEHWVEGEPVTGFEPGRVYVVEFWATWCPPCRASIPHLSELQEAHADNVTIIGISDEPLETVQEFMAAEASEGVMWNEQVQYTLVTDPDRSSHRSYMDAANQAGIPTAFIVGRTGVIEWIGHPMAMDDPLTQVVSGEWNRAEARQALARAQAAEQARMARFEAMMEARETEDWEALLALLDEMIEESNGDPGARYQKFATLLVDVKDARAAYQYARDLVDDVWDDPNFLNAIAWFIVDEPGIEHRDLDLALRAAERANELVKGKSGAILDTVARVHYEGGRLDEAVKWQRLALEHSEPGAMHDDIQRTLERYEAQAGATAGAEVVDAPGSE